MWQIELDGARMPDRTAMHRVLREALRLPEYYGNNLDALNDCLSERTEPMEVYIRNFDKLGALDQRYAGIMLNIMETNGAIIEHD